MSLRRRSKFAPLGRATSPRLRGESLEQRLPLTADLSLGAVVADELIIEGGTIDVSFEFTDTVETTAGDSVGLDPTDFTSLGVFDPTDPAATIVFDTDALTVTGFTAAGTTVSADTGAGAYDIAVFTFDSFDLDDGQSILATGSNPFAILSLSDMTIGGVIDASAQGNALGTGVGALAGPGGGAGGLPGLNGAAPTDGEAAAGAPANSVGETDPVGSTGDIASGGGAFGGFGGEPNDFNDPGREGVRGGNPYGDLTLGVQGGSGGGGAQKFFASNSRPQSEGGGGGGGVELGAVGDITVEATGSVLADGAAGETVATSESGGGGAGGGVLVHGADVTIAGLLSAEGGDATATNAFSESGGGGGGRILVAHSGSYDDSAGTISVAGGQSGQDNNSTSFGGNGQDGVFTVVPVAGDSTVDNYTYSIDLVDSLGAVLDALVTDVAVTDITINTAGDGLTGAAAEVALNSTLFADDADLFVRVTVSDDRDPANIDSQTVALTVANDDPASLALVSTAQIDENGTATLDLSFTDAGLVDEHTVTVDWGDGTVEDVVLTVGDRAAQLTHQYLDDDPTGTPSDATPIGVTVADDDGGSASDTASIIVDNVAPELTNLTTDSAAIGGAQQGETVNLTADFSDVGTLDTHTAVIDWGDGTVTAGVVDQAASTITDDHAYEHGGFYDVTVTLTDDDTGEATSLTETVIAGVNVQDGTLVGVGTEGDDIFKVFRSWWGDSLFVKYSLDGGDFQWKTVDGSTVDQIDLLLGVGHDIGFLSSRVRQDAHLDGGDGDDLLVGGKGDDELLGGAGYDLMFGQGGRDLIIGGTGGDLIFGDGGQDILVSGLTAFDQDRAALDLIMAEWTSDRSYNERVDNLTGDHDLSMDGLNEEVFLIAEGEDATVFDDESTDWLLGGRGRDLYFAGEDDISFARFWETVEAIEAEAPPEEEPTT